MVKSRGEKVVRSLRKRAYAGWGIPSRSTTNIVCHSKCTVILKVAIREKEKILDIWQPLIPLRNHLKHTKKLIYTR